MSRHLARIAVAFACALAAAWASDAVPQAATGVPEHPEPPKLVVLKNGDVVEGEIRFAQGGYEVQAKAGRVFLADSYVWFTAQHRRQAYDQLRERAPCRTADDHTALAKWCLANRLHSCAQEELHTALEQEPDHADARATLVTLRDVLRTGSSGTPAAAPAASAPLRGQNMPGGVPPTVARDFVARVQPLLVNRCANAACHGTAAENGFRLSVVRPGNPAYHRLTQQNLEAVRRQITSPDSTVSPLLIEARRPDHGGIRKPLFPGPAGEAQLLAITAWVSRAAKVPLPPVSSPPPAASPIELTDATQSDEPPSMAVRTADEPRGETPADDATGDLLRDVLAEERPDAFDPNDSTADTGRARTRRAELPEKDRRDDDHPPVPQMRRGLRARSGPDRRLHELVAVHRRPAAVRRIAGGSVRGFAAGPVPGARERDGGDAVRQRSGDATDRGGRRVGRLRTKS